MGINEFNYWLITEEGKYYTELFTAIVLALLPGITFITLSILAIIDKSIDLLMISLIMGYLSIYRIKKAIKIWRDRKELQK